MLLSMLHGYVFILILSLTRRTFIKLGYNSAVDKPIETRPFCQWYVLLKTTVTGRYDQNFETGSNSTLHP